MNMGSAWFDAESLVLEFIYWHFKKKSPTSPMYTFKIN